MNINEFTVEEAMDLIIIYGRLLEAFERNPSKDLEEEIKRWEKRLENI